MGHHRRQRGADGADLGVAPDARGRGCRMNAYPGQEGLRNPLKVARGLGPSRSGVRPWWIQRITAVALLPLSIWFLFLMGGVLHSDYPMVLDHRAAGARGLPDRVCGVPVLARRTRVGGDHRGLHAHPLAGNHLADRAAVRRLAGRAGLRDGRARGVADRRGLLLIERIDRILEKGHRCLLKVTRSKRINTMWW